MQYWNYKLTSAERRVGLWNVRQTRDTVICHKDVLQVLASLNHSPGRLTVPARTVQIKPMSGHSALCATQKAVYHSLLVITNLICRAAISQRLALLSIDTLVVGSNPGVRITIKGKRIVPSLSQHVTRAD